MQPEWNGEVAGDELTKGGLDDLVDQERFGHVVPKIGVIKTKVAEGGMLIKMEKNTSSTEPLLDV